MLAAAIGIYHTTVIIATILRIIMIYEFVRHAMSAYRLSLRHNGAQCHKDWLMMTKLSSLVCTENLVWSDVPNQTKS